MERAATASDFLSAKELRDGRGSGRERHCPQTDAGTNISILITIASATAVAIRISPVSVTIGADWSRYPT
ncbi:hypothetical protein HAL_09770 [Haladaptatus sp. T7]|nr:hypothetical protein HAL_09770 [Haladaptatus sp. T7]